MNVKVENSQAVLADKPELDDIASETMIRIEISKINFYARNPRQQINPEYDRIKASIRAEGLDQPLVVTRQPDATDYVLQAGGNTRLRILKELHEETGDKRFYWVSCLFKPWVHESNVLLAHLRENDLRGNLHFIDKAQAVFDAKHLLESELNIEKLTHRQLETLFKERGFSLSRSMISHMGYTVQILLPLIPEALSAGLGRPQIEKIRGVERTARQIWLKRDLGNEDMFVDVFKALCARYDGPEWDCQLLRGALENELASEAECDLQGIRLEFEAGLSGREFIPAVIDYNEKESSNEFQGVSDSVKEKAKESEAVAEPSEGDDGLLSSSNVDQETPIFTSQGFEEVIVEEAADSVEGMLPPPFDRKTNDLQSLRGRAYRLALGLAQRNGLGGLIEPLPGEGLGFLLRDVPPLEVVDALDQDMLGQVSTLWWQLAACSEVTVAPVEYLVGHLAEGTILRQALENQDAGLLFSSVLTLDPGHLGHQLWQQLSDEDWQDLLQLITTYRQIKQLALRTGELLWR